ncbi:unknown protein (plasmid) [Synechocystis sp. PCC 6803]|uniref:Uncharacterized protein n=1 Tax=Synechocystis sp. (strain ATCC 27184 / PCC 6803 / Kazusa) TaxID=1111708 RepID=Q6ZEH9_SYNY3|nr:unknown protein [Synechocystis sp. PCC 6803]
MPALVSVPIAGISRRKARRRHYPGGKPEFQSRSPGLVEGKFHSQSLMTSLASWFQSRSPGLVEGKPGFPYLSDGVTYSFSPDRRD